MPRLKTRKSIFYQHESDLHVAILITFDKGYTAFLKVLYNVFLINVISNSFNFGVGDIKLQKSRFKKRVMASFCISALAKKSSQINFGDFCYS